MTKDQVRRTQSLYMSMPGAVKPPISKYDGQYEWGEVEGTEHWEFCESIIHTIDNAVGSAINRLASDHNLV